MIICAGWKTENFPFAKAIGIGLIESAINLTRICLEFQPKELIFIGTCGLYERGEILEYLLKALTLLTSNFQN